MNAKTPILLFAGWIWLSAAAMMSAADGRPAPSASPLPVPALIYRIPDNPNAEPEWVSLQLLPETTIRKVRAMKDRYHLGPWRWPRPDNMPSTDDDDADAPPADEGVTAEKMREAEARKAVAEAERKADEAEKKSIADQKHQLEDVRFALRLAAGNYVYLQLDADFMPNVQYEIIAAREDGTASRVHYVLNPNGWTYSIPGRPESYRTMSRVVKNGRLLVTLPLISAQNRRICQSELWRFQIFRWSDNAGASWGDQMPGVVGPVTSIVQIPGITQTERANTNRSAYVAAAQKYYLVKKDAIKQGPTQSLEAQTLGWIEWRATLTVANMKKIYQRPRRIGFLIPGVSKLFLGESGILKTYRPAMKKAAQTGAEDLKNPYLQDYIMKKYYGDFADVDSAIERLCSQALRNRIFRTDYPDCEVE